MRYEPPVSRVADLELEFSFLASGNDELTNSQLEPIDYDDL